LQASFLRSDGIVRDHFAILKTELGERPFEIVSHGVEGGMLTLRWNSVPGEFYSVQRTTNLEAPQWLFISGAERATGPVTTRVVPLPASPGRAIYRIINSAED
jgi:hypothetical protein